MDYISLSFSLEGKPTDTAEIAIALLSEIGFESFTDDNNTFVAYIQKPAYDETAWISVMDILKNNIGTIDVNISEIPAQNWNSQWESNFEPVEIDTRCIVRAPFHRLEKSYDYDIVIEPKMSFGTGHHETTQLMIEEILDLDCTNKKVVDCGCGTGVLAIVAKLKEAGYTKAFDIDQWCYENTMENIQRNNVADISVECKGIESIKGEIYDIIIANINRNILLESMNQFANSLNKSGILLLSGIYKQDTDIIKNKASEFQLHFISFREKNNWVSCKFIKE